ncbi:MAG: hypothetical protein ACI4XJ_02710 [Eubacteriales bacterium]
MAEYINQEKLAFEMCEAVCGEERFLCESFPKNCQQKLMRIIYDQPTVVIKPAVHAHWIFEQHPRDTGYHFIRIVCSNCGLKTDGKSNYCPNCGAKMDEEDKT